LNDPRVELLHLDARRYLEDNDSQFDVIISDLPEPVEEGPSRLLYTRQFYRLVEERLKPGGLLALQGGDFQPGFFWNLTMPFLTPLNRFCPMFALTALTCLLLTLIGVLWSPPGMEPWADLMHRQSTGGSQRRGLELRYYDGETHRGMFAIPLDIRRRRDAETIVIDDARPLTIY
jgi:spermidine synthase